VHDVVFMDFEASSLRDGYPVEVGWACIGDGDVLTSSLLIAPADEWLTPAYSWDPMAEALHGLQLDRLQAEGKSPKQVGRILNDQLHDRIVAFDTGPAGVDRYWLALLFAEAGLTPAFKVSGTASDILATAAREYNVDKANLATIQEAAPRPTHRAASDAAHYAWRLLTVLKIGQAGLGQASPPLLVPQVWRLARHIVTSGDLR
jgi:hypothetical protein